MINNFLIILFTCMYCLSSYGEVSIIITFTPPSTRVDNSVLTPEELATMNYKIYAGTLSENYTYEALLTTLTPEDGKLRNNRIVPFSPNQDIYFAATAIDSNGLESVKSVEVIRKGKLKLLPPGIPEIISSIYEDVKYVAYFSDTDDFEIDEATKTVHMSSNTAFAAEKLFNHEYQIAGYTLNGEVYKVEIH